MKNECTHDECEFVQMSQKGVWQLCVKCLACGKCECFSKWDFDCMEGPEQLRGIESYKLVRQ